MIEMSSNNDGNGHDENYTYYICTFGKKKWNRKEKTFFIQKQCYFV